MRRTLNDIQQLEASVHERWGTLDWERAYPWWRKPAKVRVLLYADGRLKFNGGPPLGLQYLITLLRSRVYRYVDFEITTAHRDGDVSATFPEPTKLSQLDLLERYDEIFFFGETSGDPRLDPDEVALLEQFMSAPKSGGVLVTGDHENVGRGLSEQIPRGGQMRRYGVPGPGKPHRHSTLVEGPDSGPDDATPFSDGDQSDDTPQRIRYKHYPVGRSLSFPRRHRPHPILCGPHGPIDVLPDHGHEGEAVAPVPAATDASWPSKRHHQQRPEVIAWGAIKDPETTDAGREFGVISVYDGHNVDVGRIVADSTWHHWADKNLTGIAAPPSPYAGFDATPAGRAALTKIDAYFLNCAVWLAPPSLHAAMRNAAWWSILWTDQVVELRADAPLAFLGQQAIEALGRHVSRCTISQWLFDWPIFKERIRRWEWPEVAQAFMMIDLPIELFLAGGILKQLMLAHGPGHPERGFPTAAPDDRLFERAMLGGVEEGLAAFSSQLKREARLAAELVESDYRLPRSGKELA